MRRRQMMQKVSRISLGVVVGLLFLALIWKFAGAQLAKKGIVLSNDTAAKTVSETAPGAVPLWLAHILGELDVFPTGFSKYGVCYRDNILEKYINGVITCV